MFNLLKDVSKTYTWPVEVKVPVSGKKYTTIKFDAEFNRLGKTESKSMLDAAKTTDDNGDETILYKRVLDEVLVSLKAKDDAGNYGVLPDDVREELLELSGAEAAVFTAYFASLSGERAKN